MAADTHTSAGHAAPAVPLTARAPAHLPEWLPGVFAARLCAGVILATGRICGETDRTVHLFPIPATRVMPENLTAFCGQRIRSGEADLITVGTGMPCVPCVLQAPDPPNTLT